jgi:hypothetical protein
MTSEQTAAGKSKENYTGLVLGKRPLWHGRSFALGA